MNRTLVIALFLWCSQLVGAQDSLRIVTWENALKLSPDSVFAIDASHLKWTNIPDELYAFKHLKYLNLSRNKLDELPMQLNGLKELVSLDVSRNKLDTFPTVLCSMTYLKKLSVSRNLIESIPPCIGYFDKLVYLDLWDNPIRALPEELTKLEALKKVDLRGILFSQSFQDKWRTTMPQVKWEFDAPCDCLD